MNAYRTPTAVTACRRARATAASRTTSASPRNSSRFSLASRAASRRRCSAAWLAAFSWRRVEPSKRTHHGWTTFTGCRRRHRSSGRNTSTLQNWQVVVRWLSAVRCSAEPHWGHVITTGFAAATGTTAAPGGAPGAAPGIRDVDLADVRHQVAQPRRGVERSRHRRRGRASRVRVVEGEATEVHRLRGSAAVLEGVVLLVELTEHVPPDGAGQRDVVLAVGAVRRLRGRVDGHRLPAMRAVGPQGEAAEASFAQGRRAPSYRDSPRGTSQAPATSRCSRELPARRDHRYGGAVTTGLLALARRRRARL